MHNTSLRKFMIIDLLILGIIGCVIEAVLMYAFNMMINANLIASAASLLVLLVAISRWGKKGLFLIPFLALSTVLSGRFFNVHEYYREYYDWQFYISVCCSLLASGVSSMVWYKYSNQKLTFKSPYKTFGLCFINIFVSLITLSLIYFLIPVRVLVTALFISLSQSVFLPEILGKSSWER